MILPDSVDVYQQMHVLWTKYSTELDSLAPVQCNNTFMLKFEISGLSGGFIGEFHQLFCCLFSSWWSDKDTDCTCCVDCVKTQSTQQVQSVSLSDHQQNPLFESISAFQGYMTYSAVCFLSFCV